MRRVFCAFVIIMMWGTLVQAGCKGGTSFTGRNGTEYCLSNFEMNWWAAYMWCQANGMKLATPSELCDYGVHPWNGDRACWNINGKVVPNGHMWVNLTRPDGYVYVVQGNFSIGYGNRDRTGYFAICAPL